MSLITEYLNNLKTPGYDLYSELKRLIVEYNALRGTYLLVFNTAFHKGSNIEDILINQIDYYYIKDILANSIGRTSKLDVYLETPGGSGEAAEEIVNFLHDKFEHVTFVISGEAKSAGTIMALSGNDIMMTESGSLGPIDAQVICGRSRVSAYDYVEWITEKYKESKAGILAPVDGIIIAQISPGEIKLMNNLLNYSKDLVKEWIYKYKFNNWYETEQRQKPVTNHMKRARAAKIANAFANHTRWRSHGRSLKIKDVNEIGLKVIPVDSDERLCDLVYRIQVVCRLLFDTSSIYKMYVTADNQLFKNAVTANQPASRPSDYAMIEFECPNCHSSNKMYIEFKKNPEAEKDIVSQGYLRMPADMKMSCNECGSTIDVSGIKDNAEREIGKKALL